MNSLIYERIESVGVITLNDPDNLNALTKQSMGELIEAIAECSVDPKVRALLLTGNGAGFCSGLNLRFAEELSGNLVPVAMQYAFPMIQSVRECSVPVVAGVNGVAAGGGFSLALACDVIVAARSATFIQVFSRIGLVPDLGSTWMLPRIVGRQRALDIMFSNRPLPAETAREWGIVAAVVPDAELRHAALDCAQRLARGPTAALAQTRALVDAGTGATFADHFRRELEVQSGLHGAADGREGVAAFLERRPARFTGGRGE